VNKRVGEDVEDEMEALGLRAHSPSVRARKALRRPTPRGAHYSITGVPLPYLPLVASSGAQAQQQPCDIASLHSRARKLANHWEVPVPPVVPPGSAYEKCRDVQNPPHQDWSVKDMPNHSWSEVLRDKLATPARELGHQLAEAGMDEWLGTLHEEYETPVPLSHRGDIRRGNVLCHHASGAQTARHKGPLEEFQSNFPPIVPIPLPVRQAKSWHRSVSHVTTPLPAVARLSYGRPNGVHIGISSTPGMSQYVPAARLARPTRMVSTFFSKEIQRKVPVAPPRKAAVAQVTSASLAKSWNEILEENGHQLFHDPISEPEYRMQRKRDQFLRRRKLVRRYSEGAPYATLQALEQPIEQPALPPAYR